MTYTINIDWHTDFYIYNALRKEVKKTWEDAIVMSIVEQYDEHYYAEKIDIIADVMLEIMKHEKLSEWR